MLSLFQILCTVTSSGLLPQINNLTPEWEYLFELAGVNRAMLEDPATLQFILDTVYQLGGAPQKLELVQQEAISSGKII